MIENADDLWQERLHRKFAKKNQTEIDKFMNIVSIILYGNNTTKDVADLFSIVDIESFIKIISLFDGRDIQFPSKKELQDAIELALFFYYKNIQGITSYKDLKLLNIVDEKDFSSISIGKKLLKLEQSMQDKILEIFMEMKDE